MAKKQKPEQVQKYDKSKQPGSLPYVWKGVRRNKGAMVGIVLICVIVILSLLSPLIMQDYALVNMRNQFATPSAEHLFGCDHLGRDIMARIFYGARFTLAIGIGAVAFSAVLGIIIGAIAGYFGGAVETVIMYIMDILQSFPGLVSAIAVAMFLTQKEKL